MIKFHFKSLTRKQKQKKFISSKAVVANNAKAYNIFPQ